MADRNRKSLTAMRDGKTERPREGTYSARWLAITETWKTTLYHDRPLDVAQLAQGEAYLAATESTTRATRKTHQA